MLSETLRQRWFSVCLQVGLWVLLLLAVFSGGRGGHLPEFQEAGTGPGRVTTPVPVARLKRLFAVANQEGMVVNPPALGLFKTTHFVPAGQPPPAQPLPAPPPPTTQKIELTYQGYYQAGDSPKFALLRLGDKLVSIPLGGRVVTNLFVVDAALKTLTLTNSAVQTNVLNLNTKQIVEVPL